MKTSSILRSVAVGILSVAMATAAAAADVVFPTASRIGLVPPAGMTVAKDFPGFENPDKNVFIRLIAMPANAYGEFEKTLNDATLKSGGMTLEKRETLSLPSGNGILVTVRQEAGPETNPQAGQDAPPEARPQKRAAPKSPAASIRVRKWLLIAPIDNLTAMVSFEMPVASPAPYSDAEIRTTLATIAARPHVPDDEQLALVPFKMGDLAGLRLIRVAPGVAAQFTDGPQDSLEAPDQAYLVIAAAAGGPDQAVDRDRFARAAFGGLPPFTDVRMTNAEPMRLGGQPGHEIRARGKDPRTGSEVEIVQWLRFGTGAYLRILGYGPKDKWAETFTRFRAVRDGLEPR
jgi:hypothetical protein